MSGSSSTTRTVASLTRGPSAARAHPSAITPFSTADRAVLFDVVMRGTAYPKELEGNVELRDGTRVHIRPIRPEDEARLVRFYERLSRDTAYQRFFTVMHRLPPDWARYLAAVDYVCRLALVVVGAADPEAEVIAVARYEPSDEPNTAEVAFVVEDRWQGRGLGSVLFDRLLGWGAAWGGREH